MTDNYDVIVKEIQRLIKHLNGKRAIFAMDHKDGLVTTYWHTAHTKESKVSDATYLACHLIKDIMCQAEEDDTANSRSEHE